MKLYRNLWSVQDKVMLKVRNNACVLVMLKVATINTIRQLSFSFVRLSSDACLFVVFKKENKNK